MTNEADKPSRSYLWERLLFVVLATLLGFFISAFFDWNIWIFFVFFLPLLLFLRAALYARIGVNVRMRELVTIFICVFFFLCLVISAMDAFYSSSREQMLIRLRQYHSDTNAGLSK